MEEVCVWRAWGRVVVEREREKKMFHVSRILIPKDKLPSIRWVRAKASIPNKMGRTSVLFDQTVDIDTLLKDLEQNPVLAVLPLESIQKGKHYLFPLGDSFDIRFLPWKGSNLVFPKSRVERLPAFVWNPKTSYPPSFEMRIMSEDSYASRVVEIEYPRTSLTFVISFHPA